MVAGSMPTAFNIIVSSDKKTSRIIGMFFLILSGVACSNWELVSGSPNKNQNSKFPSPGGGAGHSATGPAVKVPVGAKNTLRVVSYIPTTLSLLRRAGINVATTLPLTRYVAE